MMPLVLQLQQDALNREVPVTDLLRKALVVARKLKLPEFESWIRRELEGYQPDAEFPPYRKMRGQVRGWNPFHGWLPVHIQNAEHAERIMTRPTPQPIAEIEDLLADQKTGELQMPFDPDAEMVFQRATQEVTSFVTLISRSALAGILNAVRNTILNWTLELEAKDVVGEGLSFTAAELKAAAGSGSVNNYFMGPVQTAQIQHSSPYAIQVAAPPLDLAELRRFLESWQAQVPGLGLEANDRASVAAEVATIEAALTSPTPRQSVIRECLESMRRVLEGAAGNVAGPLILQQLIQLLGGGAS